MKRVLLLAALCVPIAAQQPSTEQWRSDLAYLAGHLTRLHMNFYAHVTPDDFGNAVGSLDSSIPAMTPSQIRAAMSRLVAMGQDSHTSIAIGTQSRQFPFALKHFADGWYLTVIDPSARDKLGWKLTALGGVDAESLADAVAPYIPHDNRSWLVEAAPGYLCLEDVLNAMGLVTSRGTVRLDLQDSGGSPASLELSPGVGALYTSDLALGAALPLYRQRPNEAYWYQYDGADRLLYVRYRKCAEQPGRPSGAFWQEVLDAFDQNPVDRLVIDFRDNTGGDDSIINPLMNGIQQRFGRLGNPTRVYGLMNGGTFSSGLLDVMSFKEGEIMMGLPFVRIFGEPTGGNPNHFGNVFTYQLPASGISFQLSSRYFGSMFKDDALQPDVLVPLRSDQYFQGVDPVWDAVLADPLK